MHHPTASRFFFEDENLFFTDMDGESMQFSASTIVLVSAASWRDLSRVEDTCSYFLEDNLLDGRSMGCNTKSSHEVQFPKRSNKLRQIQKPLVHWVLPENLNNPQQVKSYLKGTVCFCKFKSKGELAQAVRQAWTESRCVIIPTTVSDQAVGFCGAPQSLEELTATSFQVIPLFVENWGGIQFGSSSDKRTSKSTIRAGRPIPSTMDWLEQARASLLALGQEAICENQNLQLHLGRACMESLQRRQSEVVMHDAYQNRSFTGGKLLSVAIVLSKWIRHHVPQKRVGAVLPPGAAAMLVNLACVLADKVPVNLNFTAGRQANASAISQAQIETIFTADAFAQKCRDFPWSKQRLDIVEVLQSLSKIKIIFWRGLLRLFPVDILADRLGLAEKGMDAEAGLLFTSGSSGDPKGVVLSHQNILANVMQVSSVLGDARINSLLGCLPVFHSFGFTVTLWWPLLGGPRVITYPSALEISKLAEIVDQYKIEMLITTPTFLRGWIRKSTPLQLASLRVVITGAEKLPLSILQEFEKKFNLPVCEGYGMTEATPVIAVNLLEWKGQDHSKWRRVGSVGRLLPGVAVRVTDTEGKETLPLSQTGLLWFCGANIFGGYLNDPARSAQVLKEGWYCAGDIGHIDQDGFLYIEGRQSRFSKIGGEMVPHATIEQKMEEMCRALGDSDEVRVVVMGVRDLTKGEALVALTTSVLDPAALRQKLSEAQLPNLWIPKIIKHVETIPTLASGKLDLKACQLLAEKVGDVAGDLV